jgi:hypothetical protein
MDDSQVEELRRWAVGLSNDPRPEVKAAAKAILMLTDDLRAARSQLWEERMIREALEAREPEATAEPPTEAPTIERDLFRRLGSLFARRRQRSAEGSASEPEDQETSLQGTPPVSQPTRQ